MEEKNIYIYNKEEFREFYNKLSESYNIISITSLLNLKSELNEEYFKSGATLVDITSLIKLIGIRQDLIMYYEIVINYLIEEYDYKFIVEENYADKVLDNLPEYFLEKVYLIDEELNDNINEKNSLEDELNVNFSILVYNDLKSFREKNEGEKVQVISIATIIESINSLIYSVKINELKNNQEYIIDITSMIKVVEIRNELILQFEIILNELARLNNVKFAIESNEVHMCKKLFQYNFREYIEVNDKGNSKKEKKEYPKIVDMSDNEIDAFVNKFNKELIGHASFKKDLKKQIKKYIILNKMNERPIFSIFLCGNSGIGKTEVARIFNRILYNGCKEIKINFGNYSGKGSLWSLIGSPKGYKGSEEGGELTNKIRNSESKVILIDEFEKADGSIYSFFYELLEDGKFTDLDENEIDLNGYIIIFTSNLNEDNYRKYIPDSLFSRFSMKYIFEELTDEDKQEYVKVKVDNLIEKYNEQTNKKFDISKKELLLHMDVSDLDNVRDIYIRLTDSFIELVD